MSAPPTAAEVLRIEGALLTLEDDGLDQYLLRRLHHEYVIQLAPETAHGVIREISSVVANKDGDVDCPARVAARAWASIKT